MPLTNIEIKNAKPRTKPYKLWDGGSLYIEVMTTGSKLWRWKYRVIKSENRFSIGPYPEISIKQAREARDGARALLRNGIDPNAHKKAKKATQSKTAGDTFEVLALEWHTGRSRIWSSIHSKNVMDRLTRNVFPYVGRTSIAEITVPELLRLLRRIEERGANETAHRVLGNISEVYRYAIASGKAERNIALDIKGALQPVVKTHLPAITEPKRVGELLRMIDGYSGTLPVQCALKLAPLVFVRPAELRNARWAEVDFESREWRYVITKTATPHIVPLCNQAIDILQTLKPLTGRSEFVFPNARSLLRPMSNNAVLAAMRRMEISKDEMCGHGFRAMAKTILIEELGYSEALTGLQLAHRRKDPLGNAYNRTTFIRERTEMMQEWANYLDGLKLNERS